jgi:hypothetical protein
VEADQARVGAEHNRKADGRRTVASARTNFEHDREFSLAQLAHQQSFREAAAYAKVMKGQAIYIHLLGWIGGKVEYLNLHTD